MSNQVPQDDDDSMNRIGDRLVELGYAKNYGSGGDMLGFNFTPKGDELRRQIREFFGVPKVHPHDVSRHDAMTFIAIMLFAGEK